MLGLGSREDEAGQEENPAVVEVVAYPEEGTPKSETSQEKGSPHPKSAKWRKPRKKVTRNKDQEWERARQDAWLREMLTDTSESETEEKYGRFAESGRWITGLFGIPQQATTTSRVECSGQKMPDS